MLDEKIVEHRGNVRIDYLSWKQLLNADGTEPVNGEINVIISKHELGKSLEFMDSYANRMNYSKHTPIYIKPKTEEVPVEKTIDKELNTNSPDVGFDLNRVLAETTALLECIKKRSGVKFISDFIYVHTQRSKQEQKLMESGLIIPQNNDEKTNAESSTQIKAQENKISPSFSKKNSMINDRNRMFQMTIQSANETEKNQPQVQLKT